MQRLSARALGRAVLVADLDFDPGDLLPKARERIVQEFVGPALQGFLVFDAIAGVHLYLHGESFGWCLQCGDSGGHAV